MGKGTGGVMDVVLGRRYTRNPESPPLRIDIPIFFLPWTELVKFLLKIFELFFLLPFSSYFCSKYGISFLHVYPFPLFLVFQPEGSALKGGHCHKPHRVVSPVTPVTLL